MAVLYLLLGDFLEIVLKRCEIIQSRLIIHKVRRFTKNKHIKKLIIVRDNLVYVEDRPWIGCGNEFTRITFVYFVMITK